MPHTAAASPVPAATKTRNWFGPTVAILLGAAFAAISLNRLSTNLQYDGQLPEFLAWSQAPSAWGHSLNAELNRHLYSVYYVVLAGGARLIDRELLLKIAFILEILAVSLAVYHVVNVVTGDRWAAWLAVAIDVWQRGSAIVPGGSSSIGIVASPEYPATALALLGLAYSWKGRHRLAAICAGLAFNLHGSIAAFAGAMVICAAALDGRRNLRSILSEGAQCAARFVLGAAPTLIWISLNPPPAAHLSTDAWLRFPYWIYPDHMIPSATPARMWLMLLAYLAPGWLGLAALIDRWRIRRSVMTGWLIATATLLIVGYVFVELIPIRPIAQLTLFRGTRFLILILLGFGLSYLLSELRRPGFAGFAAAMALSAYATPLHPELAWVGHLGLAGLLAVTATRLTGWRRAITALAMAAAVSLVIYDAGRFPQLGGYIAGRWPIAALGLAAAFFILGRTTKPIFHVASLAGLATLHLWLTRVDVAQPVSATAAHRAVALRELAPIIAKSCPPGQIVIAPPDLRNPGAWAGRGSFLCRQQLTAYAYAPWLADEILRRMQWFVDEPIDATTGRTPIVGRLAAGYRTRTAAQFEQLRDAFGVRVAIVEHDRRLAFPRVGGNALFDVYDLGEPRPATVVASIGDGGDQ